MKTPTKLALAISIVLFIVSLTQNAYCTTNLCRPGYDAFICGALFGFATGGASWTWFANPLLFISWFRWKSADRTSFTISIIAFCIALTFLFLPVVGDNEAGHINRIISRDLGYWLWLASALTMLVSNTLPYIKNLGKDTNL